MATSMHQERKEGSNPGDNNEVKRRNDGPPAPLTDNAKLASRAPLSVEQERPASHSTLGTITSDRMSALLAGPVKQNHAGRPIHKRKPLSGTRPHPLIQTSNESLKIEQTAYNNNSETCSNLPDSRPQNIIPTLTNQGAVATRPIPTSSHQERSSTVVPIAKGSVSQIPLKTAVPPRGNSGPPFSLPYKQVCPTAPKSARLLSHVHGVINNNVGVYAPPPAVPTNRILPQAYTSAPSTTSSAGDSSEETDYNSNFWLKDEEERFLVGLQMYGWGQWKSIQAVVKTRTNKQIKSHAQKRVKVNPEIRLKYLKTGSKCDCLTSTPMNNTLLLSKVIDLSEAREDVYGAGASGTKRKAKRQRSSPNIHFVQSKCSSLDSNEQRSNVSHPRGPIMSATKNMPPHNRSPSKYLESRALPPVVVLREPVCNKKSPNMPQHPTLSSNHPTPSISPPISASDSHRPGTRVYALHREEIKWYPGIIYSVKIDSSDIRFPRITDSSDDSDCINAALLYHVKFDNGNEDLEVHETSIVKRKVYEAWQQEVERLGTIRPSDCNGDLSIDENLPLPRHPLEGGTPVYAQWVDERNPEMYGKWLPGTVNSSREIKITINPSQHKIHYVYHILYDNGEEDKQLNDNFVLDLRQYQKFLKLNSTCHSNKTKITKTIKSKNPMTETGRNVGSAIPPHKLDLLLTASELSVPIAINKEYKAPPYVADCPPKRTFLCENDKRNSKRFRPTIVNVSNKVDAEETNCAIASTLIELQKSGGSSPCNTSDHHLPYVMPRTSSSAAHSVPERAPLLVTSSTGHFSTNVKIPASSINQTANRDAIISKETATPFVHPNVY